LTSHSALGATDLSRKTLQLADHVHRQRQKGISASAAKAVGNLGIPKKRRGSSKFLVEILTTECSETPSATLKAAIE